MLRRCLAFALLFVSLAGLRSNADAAPGVTIGFESADGKQSDVREGRLFALSVPQGTPPTSFLAPTRFRATLTGFINLKIRDQYAFRAGGRGEFELLINGVAVLAGTGEDFAAKSTELIKLKKGANEIVVKYTAPAEGDALFRLNWAEKNKPFDPVPPTVLTHEVDAVLAERTQLRQGREFMATMRCLRCHAPPDDLKSHDGAMPELAIDAPNLDDVGSRLNPQWVAKWIENPKSLRADAAMPRVFAKAGTAEAGAAVARDIAAYLSTRSAKTLPAPPADLSDANVVAGTRIFLNLGCIACHTAPNSNDDSTRTTLRYVTAKYRPEALRAYLQNPESHYAWTRMPNFRLSDDEAAKLTAYLFKTTPADAIGAVDLASADAERGKMFFELTGCMKCHAPQEPSRTRAKPLLDLVHGDWSGGCMASNVDARGSAPDFSLIDEQRAAIAAFAKSDWSSLSRESLPEFNERQVRAANCVACHTRDASEDAWSKLAPEIAAFEKTLPPEPAPQTEQSRPLLTWTGEKLYPQWMGKFIAGQIEYKPRPWLRARMPSFASRAKLLADGMCLDHGMPLTDTPEPAIDPDLATIGRQLIGRTGGFSCNQCHAINQTPALVPFDSPSPNFMYVNERIRKDFYHRWTRSPGKYQPGTRMPTFADAEGKTAYKNILEGDATKQFEAIWQYLRAGREIAPPE